ncbi:High-affinity zinc uptake system protein znuA precursor [Leclercia adecarboxylata]|uniref:High-affinity zinc uptake system protein znuA n=1 Tax=Leclercia adecarboxylata TaxID=83655 RepID=A0A4U9HZ96_9ENTR|nr:High-affinity zinc uptake system protein znuA precursor [Leclercia adecarboxylata]
MTPTGTTKNTTVSRRLAISPSIQKFNPVRSVYMKSEHSWLSKKRPAFLLSHSSGQAVVEAVARGTSVRMGTLDPLGTSIQLSKASYSQFLSQLANQYASCLKGD